MHLWFIWCFIMSFVAIELYFFVSLLFQLCVCACNVFQICVSFHRCLLPSSQQYYFFFNCSDDSSFLKDYRYVQNPFTSFKFLCLLFLFVSSPTLMFSIWFIVGVCLSFLLDLVDHSCSTLLVCANLLKNMINLLCFFVDILRSSGWCISFVLSVFFFSFSLALVFSLFLCDNFFTRKVEKKKRNLSYSTNLFVHFLSYCLVIIVLFTPHPSKTNVPIV